MMVKRLLKGSALLVACLGPLGCGSNAGNGALLGGAGGAGLGAIIGHQSHGHTAGGAVVGGALGAIGGALVGNEMDRAEQARRDDDRYRYYDDVPRYRTRYYYDEAPPPPPPRVYEYRVWREYGPYGPGWYTVREYRY